MDELEARMQRVLASAREGMSPSEADSAQLRRVVLASAAGTAVGMSATGAAAAGATKVTTAAGPVAASHAGGLFTTLTGLSTGTKLVAIGVCAAIGTAGVLTTQSHPTPAPQVAAVAPQPAKVAKLPSTTLPHAPLATPPVDTPPAPAADTPPAPDQPVAEPHRAPSTSRAAAPDPLAAELTLIQQARQALQAGNPQGALVPLALHEARFPSGAMSQERRALRALALCALGDDRGKREAALFLEQTPDSPLAPHLRDACR